MHHRLRVLNTYSIKLCSFISFMSVWWRAKTSRKVISDLFSSLSQFFICTFSLHKLSAKLKMCLEWRQPKMAEKMKWWNSWKVIRQMWVLSAWIFGMFIHRKWKLIAKPKNQILSLSLSPTFSTFQILKRVLYHQI